MKKIGNCSALASIVLAAATQVQAEEVDPRTKYSEPSRGFFIEHGTFKSTGEASVELHSGSDALESGGGVRLGLPRGELIINSGMYAYDEDELLFKLGMDDIVTDESEQHSINWSLIAGVSYYDIETDVADADQTNLKLGFSATVEADAGIFSLAPMLVYADGDAFDDTYVDVGIGGYVGIIDTEAGLFSLGAEAIITTADDRDDLYAFGGRWLYNEHLTIDILPFVHADDELLGIPGMVRVNATF